jgi:hypothetical protein
MIFPKQALFLNLVTPLQQRAEGAEGTSALPRATVTRIIERLGRNVQSGMATLTYHQLSQAFEFPS